MANNKLDAIMGIYPNVSHLGLQSVSRMVRRTSGELEEILLEIGTATIHVTHIDVNGRDHGYWHQLLDNDSYRIVYVAECFSTSNLWIVTGQEEGKHPRKK